MTVIELETVIKAPIERVFDLSRSIEFHQDSTDGTDERAVDGTTTGLIGVNEFVTWEATHLGFRQKLTVKITETERPRHFQDSMLRGAFKHMVHDHAFEPRETTTIMRDRFEFSAPFGLLGTLMERFFLKRYMKGLLMRRNAHLKNTAESETWKRYLPPES